MNVLLTHFLKIGSLVVVLAGKPNLANSDFESLLLADMNAESTNAGGKSSPAPIAPKVPFRPEPEPISYCDEPSEGPSAPNNIQPTEGPSPNNSGGGGGGGGGNGQCPTYSQFCAAISAYSATTAGGTPPTPSQDVYNAYCAGISGMSLGEQAQFLANCIWESGGLQYVEEIACKGQTSPSSNCPYAPYYGRGYIQLTWKQNYSAASQAIYGDNRLVQNPGLVAQPDAAWKTAFWYWNANVKPTVDSNNAVASHALGYSVAKINGAIECPSSNQAENRLRIYNKILSLWNLGGGGEGTLTGCTA